MSDKRQAAALLQNIVNKSTSYISNSSVDLSDTAKSTAVALYARIIELASAESALLEKDLLFGIPILFRTFYEAYIELALLIVDENHFDSMRLEHLEYRRRLFQFAENNPESRFHKSLAQSETFLITFQAIKNEIAELKNRNIKIKTEKAKFDQLQIEDQYRSIYFLTSDDVHNDLRLLHELHFINENNTNAFVCFKEISIGEIATVLGTTSDLLRSTPPIFQQQYASNPSKSEISAIINACDEFDKFLNTVTPLS